MIHKEFYSTGELKAVGGFIELIDCTSRGSGYQIEIDDHELCVECIPGTTRRKKGLWKYYNKNGAVILIGNYVVLDYIGVPSKKDGIWSVFQDNGRILQQIVYEEGKLIELTIFDEDGIKIY